MSKHGVYPAESGVWSFPDDRRDSECSVGFRNWAEDYGGPGLWVGIVGLGGGDHEVHRYSSDTAAVGAGE